MSEEGVGPYKIPARYKLRQKKGRVKELPVRVVDVDDLHIWLEIERDEHTLWHVGTSWTQVLSGIQGQVKDLEKDYQELMRRKREGESLSAEELSEDERP